MSGAAERRVVDLNPSAHLLDRAGDHGKAETGSSAVTRPRVVEPDEAIEDPLPVSGRDTGAVVVHPADDLVAFGSHADGDPLAGVSGRVVQEVGDGPADLIGLTDHPAGADRAAIDGHPTGA